MEIDAGTIVAQRYRVQRPLGRGGMGEVFAAENVRTGRVVAVKVLRSDSKQKASAVERFRREARAAGAINSDHVTQVLDVEDDPEHGICIVFELLEGESLIDRLKRTGPMSFEELFPIVEQVLMGLADAHRAGIIHRDLKPSNVFLERRPDGTSRVKILDFGISKLPKEVAGDTLTELGQSLGTFSFMPPEQIGKAKTVDHRADLYASGTLVFQSLSGQLPYAAKNILHMVELKTKSEPRLLGSVMGGPVPPALEAFLARCLAREPSDRYASAIETLEAWRTLRNLEVGPAHVPRGAAVSQAPTAAEAPRARGPVPTTPMLATPTSGSYGGSAPFAPPTGGSMSGSYGGSAPFAPPTGGSMGGSYGGPVPTPAPAPAPGLAGTVLLASSTGTPAPRILVPSVADTSSEGGDHSATLAMPLPRIGGSVSGVPRLHDDAPDRLGNGTQLMPHATRSTGAVPNAAALGIVPPPAGSGPPVQPPADGAAPPSAAGEEGLTTVYRRGRALAPPVGAPSSRGAGASNVGLALGVVLFAVVGFALAAALLSYVRTGQLPWP